VSPHVQGAEGSATGTPATTKPSEAPTGCGQHGRPFLAGEIPRVHNVSPEDVDEITALMRRETSMPVVVISRHDGRAKAMAGCCSTVPDDCSFFEARLDNKEGQWTVVEKRHVIQ
jgi:hypothetical protein